MLNYIIEIAQEAGNILLKHFKKFEIEFTLKEDGSPVSVADIEANNYIVEKLKLIAPNIPIISEEIPLEEFNSELFWLIDPLDGTKSFLKKDGLFTINIALIKNKIPILGVIYSPLNKEFYFAENNVAYKKFLNEPTTIIKCREIPHQGATILVSSSNLNKAKLDKFMEGKKIDKIIPLSSAHKICLIAEGKADFYPRFGDTMEWDTAAGHAIIKAAGGNIYTLNKQELKYRKLNYLNPNFIAGKF